MARKIISNLINGFVDFRAVAPFLWSILQLSSCSLIRLKSIGFRIPNFRNASKFLTDLSLWSSEFVRNFEFETPNNLRCFLLILTVSFCSCWWTGVAYRLVLLEIITVYLNSTPSDLMTVDLWALVYAGFSRILSEFWTLIFPGRHVAVAVVVALCPYTPT